MSEYPVNITRDGDDCAPQCMFTNNNGIYATGRCLLFKSALYHRIQEGTFNTRLPVFKACNDCLQAASTPDKDSQ